MTTLFNSRTEKTVDEYITPKYITDSLGEFDLDPCSPASRRPWDTAKNHIGLPDDGLAAQWFGRVWLNPPYGRQTSLWLEKLANHGNGICLIPTRTETRYSKSWFLTEQIRFSFSRVGLSSTMWTAPSQGEARIFLRY